jgi:hypothetical protein
MSRSRWTKTKHDCERKQRTYSLKSEIKREIKREIKKFQNNYEDLIIFNNVRKHPKRIILSCEIKNGNEFN